MAVATEARSVTPAIFGSDRAREIWQAAKAVCVPGPVSDQIRRVMTPGEHAYVLSVWRSIPDDGSCYMDAFHSILNADA